MCPPVHSGRQVLKHLQIAGLAREITANDLLHKRREFYDVAEFLLECDDQVPADHDRQDRPTVGNTGGGNPRTVGSEGYRPMLNAAIARRSAERRTTKSAGAPSPAPAPVLSPTEALKSFKLHEDFAINLAASRPARHAASSFDLDGHAHRLKSCFLVVWRMSTWMNWFLQYGTSRQVLRLFSSVLFIMMST